MSKTAPTPSAARIYVLDDAPVARRHARACLERLGWQVRCFSSPQAFLATVRSAPPAAALVDIFLPDVPGPWVAAELRHDAALPRLRLVAYTALENHDRAALLGSGFDEVLDKPGLPADFERLFGRPAGN